MSTEEKRAPILQASESILNENNIAVLGPVNTKQQTLNWKNPTSLHKYLTL